MIHTAEFYVDLTEKEVSNINKCKWNLRKSINGIELGIGATSGISSVFQRELIREGLSTRYAVRAHIYVNFQELLEKGCISTEDEKEITKRLIYYTESFSKGNIVLTRLDYKFDAIIENEKTRKLILKLLRKCYDKRYFMIRHKFFNGVKYVSKSRSNNIYDKEVERIDKSKKIMEYEKNVLRYEAQIKGRHIYYKYSKYKLERAFSGYFNDAYYNKYMNDMIVKVFHSGDYYNNYHASKIIDASTYKEADKEKLKKFIRKASKAGMTEAKKTVNSYYYKKYVAMLNELSINPILIPMHEKITYIKNPLRDLVN